MTKPLYIGKSRFMASLRDERLARGERVLVGYGLGNPHTTEIIPFPRKRPADDPHQA